MEIQESKQMVYKLGAGVSRVGAWFSVQMLTPKEMKIFNTCSAFQSLQYSSFCGIVVPRTPVLCLPKPVKNLLMMTPDSPPCSI
jgi:hypothetical protein